MIGFDTNILLRHTLDDDAAQSPLATAFLSDDGRLAAPARVNPVVLVASRRIAFTEEQVTIAAVEARRTGAVDVPDYLIGHLNRQAGATITVTFDGKAASGPCFSHLTA